MPLSRILVVDDSPDVVKIIELMLAGRYEIKGETDSRRTVAVATEFKPDIVLLDVIMPLMDGGKVARALKEDPALNGVAIIFMTGSTPPPLPDHPLLTKPYTSAELIREIEKALSARRPPPPSTP